MAQQLGGKVEGGHHREFGRAEVEVTEDTPLFEGVWKKGEKYPVWMSHGDRVTAAAAGLPRRRHLAECADRHDRRREAQVLRHAVPSRGGAHAAWRGAAAQFRPQDRRLPRRLDHARLQGRGDREDPQAGRQGPGDLRAVRRRRFRGRRGADPRGDRRSAHLRVRRSRPAAARRSREGRRRCSAATTTSRWFTSTRGTLFLGALAGVTDPEQKRKTIGKLFIDVFEAEAKKIGGARIPGAGHALSRRDRERVVHRRAVGDHQVAPQCRRPARAHEHEARRAAARTVQGRGARARPRARPARGVRRPPSVPGAGPRDPLPGRDHAREARHPAARRRDLYRGDPQRRALRRHLAGLRGDPAGARPSA